MGYPRPLHGRLLTTSFIPEPPTGITDPVVLSYLRTLRKTLVGQSVTMDDVVGVGTIGVHNIWISAGAMRGALKFNPIAYCSVLAQIGGSSTTPDIMSLDFDNVNQEYADFSMAMPKSWNEGTVTFNPYWSQRTTNATAGVVWNLCGLSVSNAESMGNVLGTVQKSTDTGGTGGCLYIGPTSSAITISNTPAAKDLVFFRISRVTGDSNDTLAQDARLHGIMLNITVDADNDE